MANDAGEIIRQETLARLAESRAEIRRVLEPPPRIAQGAGATSRDGADSSVFPRSRTMKLLMSGRGIGTVGALLGGLLVARPALALRVFRMLPTSAVAKMLLVKAITAYRERHP